ncbi:MAG: hypothetical protein HZB14_02675 [Actinobacteria bacterium]|nr:hypothetical protein [Actinomycetota bacterium]
MTARARIALLVLSIAVFAAFAQSASAASFKVSVRGTQYLNWSLDGNTNNCEVRRGQGSGEAKFSFKSTGRNSLFVGSGRKAPRIVGSVNAQANGTISGSFSDTLVTACDPFAPADPYIAPATGCGDTSFGLRVDLKTRGAFVYVNGPSMPGSGGSIAAVGLCPFPIDNSLLLSTDLSACGDGSNLWQRSWGVASSGGQGLFASKLSISSKRLLKTRKGKSKVITGRAVVSCNVPASLYAGGVTMSGELKYTLTLKRTG